MLNIAIMIPTLIITIDLEEWFLRQVDKQMIHNQKA